MSFQARAPVLPIAKKNWFLLLLSIGLCKSLIFALLSFAAISSHAGTAYVRNNATMSLELTAQNDGAVFGGTGDGTKITLAPGASQTINHAKSSDGLMVRHKYTIGLGQLCSRFSTTSYADAQTKPCEERDGAMLGGYDYSTGGTPSANPEYRGFQTLYVIYEIKVYNCAAATVAWGPGGICKASIGVGQPNAVVAISNNATGVGGDGTATCRVPNGWSVTGSCVASMVQPAAISATQGTLVGKIQVTWGAVEGASGYELSYRRQPEENWSSIVASSGYIFATTDESIFEFRVRGTNAAGAGDWSTIAKGFIIPQIMPLFVSQSAPENVRAGSTFIVPQTWKNNGYTTWTSDGRFYLAQATGSGNFGDGKAIFPGNVTQNSNATSQVSLVAPSAPGVYVLSRQFFKEGIPYGAPSTPVNIRVWGDATCSGIAVNKAYLYDINGTVSVQFAANNQATAMSASVWNEAVGALEARTYNPTAAAGVYKFDIPLSNHGGRIGTYRVKVDVSNVVTSSSCEVTFELRPLEKPVVQLQALIGTGPGSNSFVVGQTDGEAFLKVSVTRTEGLPMLLELAVGTGDFQVGGTSSLAAGAESASMSVIRWRPGVWGTRGYMLRVKYADPAAADQGKNLEIPLDLILPPAGDTLTLSFGPGHPLTASTTMGRAGSLPYIGALQGNWVSKLGVQGGSDLDSFLPMGETGSRQHALDYNVLYGKSLIGTARAVPPAGISLLRPIEVTTVASVPTMPVKNLQATDGTLEDLVRVTWDAPADGAAGFTYDVYRDAELIQSSKSARVVDDVPPVRGQIYNYRVVAALNVAKSGEAIDPGHMPACRAARLVGASLNADMSAINGLIEQWPCLVSLAGTSTIDALSPLGLELQGAKSYKAFSVPVPLNLKDGPHVLHLGLASEGVVLNANRTYDMPFQLNRAAIAVNDLTITYDGSPAKAGQDATSIGRFGLRMEGGSGIGFAEEVK